MLELNIVFDRYFSADMSSLWPVSQRKKSGADVLNGIAIGPDHVLLTGKLWDKMYKVSFPDWPAFAFR